MELSLLGSMVALVVFAAVHKRKEGRNENLNTKDRERKDIQQCDNVNCEKPLL